MKSVQKITILVVLLTAFITSFTGSALNLAIPDISSYFSASASVSAWIVTGYTVTVALVSIPAGCLADRTGRKRILMLGLVIFSAASGAAAFSVSIMMLIISRGIQGIGAAMIFSTNTAILTENFSGSRRGSVLGYSLAATYVGLSAGPFLGGVINHNLGWRMIFAVTTAVSLAALLLAIKGIPAGTAIGSRSANLKSLLANRPFICSSLAALLNYGATFVVSYLLSIYLQVVMGFNSQTAGLILLVQPIIISILSPVAGKISDSVSPFKISAVGMAVCAVGILLGTCLSNLGLGILSSIGGNMDTNISGVLRSIDEALSNVPVFSALPLSAPLLIIISVLVIVGAGSAFFSSPNTNAVMSTVAPEDYSFASSVLSTMRALGNTLGMLLITAVSKVYIGNTVLRQAGAHMITKTMIIVMIISASLCVAGVVLARIKPYNGFIK